MATSDFTKKLPRLIEKKGRYLYWQDSELGPDGKRKTWGAPMILRRSRATTRSKPNTPGRKISSTGSLPASRVPS